MNEIIEWSQGNPGALTFLIEMSESPLALPIALKLKRCQSIRGTNAYVLWSDLCNRNMGSVATLCSDCPDDILEDACSRQDYSGRELVKNYI